MDFGEFRHPEIGDHTVRRGSWKYSSRGGEILCQWVQPVLSFFPSAGMSTFWRIGGSPGTVSTELTMACGSETYNSGAFCWWF